MNELNPSIPMINIGDFANLLGVHQRTLRIYDKEGILCPKRTDKNRRKYSQNDLEKAKLILFLTRNILMDLFSVKMFIGFFEESNINPNEYIKKANELALKMGIDEKIQQQNILKSSRRGRKPKIH